MDKRPPRARPAVQWPMVFSKQIKNIHSPPNDRKAVGESQGLPLADWACLQHFPAFIFLSSIFLSKF
jgi:hypothetical protein